jgi:hypothetical protein
VHRVTGLVVGIAPVRSTIAWLGLALIAGHDLSVGSSLPGSSRVRRYQYHIPIGKVGGCNGNVSLKEKYHQS